MRAQIVTIGDEILIGQITDTNSQFLASKLDELGFEVRRMLSISDEAEDIRSNLDLALESSDCVILTGGLGPTKDDITKITLANYFGVGFKEVPEVRARVKEIFARYGKEVPEVSNSQSSVPENCTVLMNSNGTAPGMWFETKEGKVVISLPGVPIEMKGLMEEEVVPRLKSHFNLQFNLHRTILTVGMGESEIMGIIGEWEDQLAPKKIKLAYLPSSGRVRLRLSSRGSNRDLLEENLEEEVEKLYQLIPSIIFGEEETDLAEAVGELFKERSLTLSTAESCTGGFIAHRLTSFAGSSEFFKGSVVSYDNEVKIGVLKVEKKVLEEHGAVSQEVVEQMAMQVRAIMKTDYAVSVSGIAGPTGGSPDKPVGTVWVGMAGPEGLLKSRKFDFGNQRTANIYRTSNAVLNMLRKQLLK